MEIKKIILVAVLLACWSITRAQTSFEVASTSYSYSPITYSGQSNSYSRLHINKTTFALPLDGQGTFRPYLGGNYRYTTFDTEGYHDPTIGRFSKIELALGGVTDLNPASTLYLLLTPGLHSDMADFSGKDFQWGTRIYLQHKTSDRLQYHYGFEYRHAAFGHYLQLLAGLHAQLNEKLSVDLAWPYSAQLHYAYLPTKIAFGLRYNFALNSYRLAEYLGNDYIRTDERHLNAYAELNLWPDVVAFAQVGWRLQYDYKIYASETTYTEIVLPSTHEARVIEPFHTDFANGLTFEIGLTYRLQLQQTSE